MRCIRCVAVLQHLRTHSGDKPFCCDDCGARFAADKTLQEHRQKHTGDRPYHCNQCDRSFARTSTLKVHMAVHTACRPHVCEHCGKAFAQPGILNQHRRAVHSGNQQQWARRRRYSRKGESQTCPDCGKTLAARSCMKSHRLVSYYIVTRCRQWRNIV